MDKIVLKAQTRESKGKKARQEAQDKIPCVVYGQDMKAENLWVDRVAFAQSFDDAGTNTIVTLQIDDAKKPLNVLIYDYQNDPVSSLFTHVDFYVVNLKEEVETEIPLVFVGIAPAVKELGGTLVKNHDVLEVRALPNDLPREIEIDLSKLKTFDDQITIADIAVNDKVQILLDPEMIIATVAEPRTDEELAALDEAVDADVSKVEGVVEKEEESSDDEKKSTEQ
jgi:large subunit ribosomal protein L25